MPHFTDEEILRLIEQATDAAAAPVRRRRKKADTTETPTSNPIDDPNNPDVPKGGRWGVTGMGQSPEMFRTRVGHPGLNKSRSGKVGNKEAQALAQRIKQVKPDEIIAYSRGAPLYNLARTLGAPGDAPVTYMAPSSFRGWSDAPVPSVPAGSKVTIGDQDTLVPMKQAAKNAVAANAPMYVLPGFSHVGIMYSHGDVTPGGFEVDPEEIVQDPEMPDWGKTGTAPGGKGGPTIEKQRERVKQHVKEDLDLRRLLRIVNERF